MDISEAAKVHLLDFIGAEIGRILKYIERLNLERKT